MAYVNNGLRDFFDWLIHDAGKKDDREGGRLSYNLYYARLETAFRFKNMVKLVGSLRFQHFFSHCPL
jgi:hypothetical protein